MWIQCKRERVKVMPVSQLTNFVSVRKRSLPDHLPGSRVLPPGGGQPRKRGFSREELTERYDVIRRIDFFGRLGRHNSGETRNDSLFHNRLATLCLTRTRSTIGIGLSY
ncbi:hypothetical protein CEXT_132931 [Caerostris extrusa]|uniref:Uncharacterized protein n=1 Tax=Caerostris extrusa TaxID=172846 RepID=A0AAV4NLY9_CAEEX|nr:hypothetical protein CEXT_132931 [Caerostris extrusa]